MAEVRRQAIPDEASQAPAAEEGGAECAPVRVLLDVRQFSPRRQDLAIFIITGAVGLVTGILVSGYQSLIHYLRQGLLALGVLPPNLASAPWWSVVMVPLLGGVGIGLLCRVLPPRYGAYGVAEVMRAVRGKRPAITFREALAKVGMSAWTIATGGSVGREGPSVEVGAAVANRIGAAFALDARQCAILLAAGAAAGIAAIFHAPLAGMAYAFEIVVAEITLRTSSPIIVAAVVGAAVAHYLGAGEPLTLPPYQFVARQSWWLAAPAIAGLAAVCALAAALFTNSLRWMEVLFRHLPLPRWALPPLGFAALGGLLLLAPEVFGTGVSVVKGTLTERFILEVMVGLLLAKIIATSLTLAAGGVGGLFGPALFIGALTGGAYGMTLMLWTEQIPHYGIYAVVGMGVVLGTVIRAPITATMIVFEVTRDYRLVIPLLVTTLFSILLSRWMRHRSIYTGAIQVDAESDPALQTLGFPRADGLTEPKDQW
ncbi:MAG: chloride channel protein [Nitrospirota bacterium]|jgi:CIC family chloride channel protein